jgi:hypothetical protein
MKADGKRSMAKDSKQSRLSESPRETSGLAGWLLSRFGRSERTRPRLMLLERISLAPRQTLALVEAEGRRFLIATSTDSAPCFYPLEGSAEDLESPRPGLENSHSARRSAIGSPHSARVSW